ncbi:MAG: hypothetical protein JWQ11_3101 [Rhizobacter sp.]|nr:hypothetical protein [Rhizobacter sp.]
MNQTVVGFFDTRAQAQDAVSRLQAAGFAAQLSEEASYDSTTSTSTSTTSASHTGTDSGGMMSGIRNFFSDVFGDSHEHMSDYEEAVKRGGCVVKVSVSSDEQLAQATDVLEDAGAADIEERASQWRQPSMAASSASSDAAVDTPAAYAMSTRSTDTKSTTGTASTASTASLGSTEGTSAAIPIVEESLEVGKRTIDRGGVRVYTRTVETPVNESVQLREEHAVVERRPVDRALSEAELDGFQERSIEVREMAEKAVVSKSARVVEEVVVGKQASERTENISDTVRHTEVEVERLDGTASGMTSSAGATTGMSSSSQPTPSASSLASAYPGDADYVDTYKSDYDTRYASLGGSFDDYQPAYKYGHTMANDQSYSGRDWDDLEPTLKSDWSSKNPGNPWEKVKDGVKHAWHVARG